jgi:hypothetical protein
LAYWSIFKREEQQSLLFYIVAYQTEAGSRSERCGPLSKHAVLHDIPNAVAETVETNMEFDVLNIHHTTVLT